MGVMLYSKLECTVLVVACALISLALTSLLVYYYVEVRKKKVCFYDINVFIGICSR